MVLHADAAAQNRATRVGTGRIHRNDAQRLARTSVMLGKLIDQRALPRPGRAGKTQDARLAAMREERFQQFSRLGAAILDRTDGASQRACVTRTQPLYPGLEVALQTFQCKAAAQRWETREK